MAASKGTKERTIFDELGVRIDAAISKQHDAAIAQLQAVAGVHEFLTKQGLDVRVSGYGVDDGKAPNNVEANTARSLLFARNLIAEVMAATGMVTGGVCTCDMLPSYVSDASKRGEVNAKLLGPSAEITVQIRYWKEDE